MIRNPDQRWMQLALAQAARGEGCTRPNPPVGAVVVKGGRVVGKGYHHRAGDPHAEVLALREAGPRSAGATLYVTLEPCCTRGRTGPCTEAILGHGVRRVVAAIQDPNPRHRGRGLRRLRRSGVAVDVGVCGEQAEQLITPFRKWIQTGLPHVTLKLGMTLDGRIADGTGRSRWITSPRSRRRVQALRRRADAVIVGIGTALADDPSLSCTGPRRQPLYRVIVDSRCRLPLDARVLRDGQAARTIIATTRHCAAARVRAYEALGARVLRLPSAGRGVSPRALMRALGRMGLLRVVCEGGGELAASLIAAGVIDEFLLFTAPSFLGGGGRPAVGGAGWPLARMPRVRIVECGRVGDDVLIRAERE